MCVNARMIVIGQNWGVFAIVVAIAGQNVRDIQSLNGVLFFHERLPFVFPATNYCFAIIATIEKATCLSLWESINITPLLLNTGSTSYYVANNVYYH